MSDFNGDPDFYNPSNPAFEKDDDTPEIYTCYFCGEKIDEGENYEHRNKTCCFECMEFQSNLFE